MSDNDYLEEEDENGLLRGSKQLDPVRVRSVVSPYNYQQYTLCAWAHVGVSV